MNKYKKYYDMVEKQSISHKIQAICIKQMCKEIINESVLINQLLRNGTRIGANIHEANYTHSKPDFIAKMQIALKECYETEY